MTFEFSLYELKKMVIDRTELCIFDFGITGTMEDENPVFTVPTYIIYPDQVLDEKRAERFLKDAGMYDHLTEKKGKAVFICNLPYTEEDADTFLKILDTCAGGSLNIKVIGRGIGADFVNMYIVRKNWAVSGMMLYGAHAGNVPAYSVPVYLSGCSEETADAFTEADHAVLKEDGSLQIYHDPDCAFNVVAVSKKKESFAEAFANAWRTVFVNNGRVGNIGGTWYKKKHSEEREYAYFSYLDCADLKVRRRVMTENLSDLSPWNTEFHLWYEYIPECVIDAEKASVPMVLLLHGDHNDPRTQAATSGWIQTAARHGLIAVEAEWQGCSVNGEEYQAMTEDDSITQHLSLIPSLLAHMLRCYPQIDPDRIYVEGLSRGGRNAIDIGLTHQNLFAAVGAHSAGIKKDKMDFESLLRHAKDSPMPIFMIFGLADTTVKAHKGFDGSDLKTPFEMYAKKNLVNVHEGDNWFGIAFDEEKVIESAGEVQVFNGILHGESGADISMNAISDWGHWNYEGAAELMWQFFSQYRRK